MLCYAMLCYAMLCYAMLCYAMLCYAMLCYAMLCYNNYMYILVIKSHNNFYFELEKPVQSDSYLLEGNLQQYSVSTVSSTYAAFNSL